MSLWCHDYDGCVSRWEPNARGRLEQAALDLFAERGFEQTTVAEIAERAGLTKRTFFRHYADKREVLFGGGAELQAIIARYAMPAGVPAIDAARREPAGRERDAQEAVERSPDRPSGAHRGRRGTPGARAPRRAPATGSTAALRRRCANAPWRAGGEPGRGGRRCAAFKVVPQRLDSPTAMLQPRCSRTLAPHARGRTAHVPDVRVYAALAARARGGAGVEAVARLLDPLAVRQRPRAQRLQRRRHRRAERRQRVLDARRHLGVDAADQQAVALHRAQRLRQHLLRDRRRGPRAARGSGVCRRPARAGRRPTTSSSAARSSRGSAVPSACAR